MSTGPLRVNVPGSTRRLEARHTPSRGKTKQLAVVAPPQPVYGGTIGNPVVKLIEAAFQKRDLATLAFNFRGTGESDGEVSDDYQESVDDYLAAARALPDAELAWLSGYSFGSVAALGSAIELSAPRVLLVAPPLALLNPELLTKYTGQLAVILGTEDDYAPLDSFHEVFDPHTNAVVELLEGVEHFFSGSSAQTLAAGLDRLLAKFA